MKIIETDGIVLKTMDFKENDSILTFLTREAGKIAGVIHGGKSTRSGNSAKTELFVTKMGVYILFVLTFIGIISVFDIAFNWNMFPDIIELAGGVFIGICFVLVLSSFLVSTMLNISRIANSIEEISEKEKNKS